MEEIVRKIEIGNEILPAIIGAYITRISPEGKKEVLLVRHGGTHKWYFPGGKIREEWAGKKPERFKAALKREILEETGVDYGGKFGSFYIDEYEIGGKRLAIGNVTALDALLSEPTPQPGNVIDTVEWTTDPLSYDLTEQARQIIETKMFGTRELPKHKKIRNPKEEA